jgi:5S rRNA maturation endonuclease (ribonuclease M5)
MGMLSKEQRKFLESSAVQYAEHLDDAAEWLAARGIDLEHARFEGLGVVRNPTAMHEGYEGRLAIPYITEFGVVNMSFRCLRNHKCRDEGCVKYLKRKGAESDLYGVRAFDDARDWIGVCEGELDSLILRQIGIPAVSNPGAKNWKEWWPNVFEDFSRVYVFADADDAGDGMYERFSDGLSKTSASVIKVKLPAGEDVNSTYVKHGADAILRRIKK